MGWIRSLVIPASAVALMAGYSFQAHGHAPDSGPAAAPRKLQLIATRGWQIGDRVQAWNSGVYYDGVIIGIGSGSMDGYFLVKTDGYNNPQYVSTANLRAGPPVTPAAAGKPRNGKYVCLLYNGGAGQFEWYLTISSGAYQQTRPDLAGGTYSYDAGGRALTFTSGPYSHNNWIGLFSVEREGKTHKIVLRDRANQARGPRVGEYSNVYCTNSTDSTY